MAKRDEKPNEIVNGQTEKPSENPAQKQPENQKSRDTRESVWVRSANGAEFWRGGVLFDHEWREVQRDTVGETAWVRIVTEPALQVKQAD